MKKEDSVENKINVKEIFLLLFSLFPIIGLMPYSNILGSIGEIMFICISVISMIIVLASLIKNKKIDKHYRKIIVYTFLFLIINLIGIAEKRDLRFFLTIYQFLSLFSFFLVISMTKWQKNSISFLSNVILLIIGLNIFYLFRGNFTKNFSGIFSNSNTLGLLLFCFLFYLFLNNLYKKNNLFFIFNVVVTLVLIYFSSTRSIFVGLFFVGITYLFWNVIIRRKKIFMFYFFVLMLTVVGIIYIYPKMIDWDNFYNFNDLVLNYTGKSIYTGRQLIWSKLIELIEQKIWFGYGAGTSVMDVLKIDLSTHNLYLQIMLQTGVLGIFTFILFLSSIWNSFWSGRNDIKVRLSASFYIGILVQQSFEVTLTQNNMPIALLQWLIIGTGSSFSLYLKKEKTKINLL